MVISPIWNFLQRSIKKNIKRHEILKHAKFFIKEALKDAINTCKSEFNTDLLHGRRGSHPPASFLGKMYDLVCSRLSDDQSILYFVITEPNEDPDLLNDVN